MLKKLRNDYHNALCKSIIRIRKTKKIEYPNFADKSSKTSKAVAWKIVNTLNCNLNYSKISGQTVGTLFELETMKYLKNAFNAIHHLRPGKWEYRVNSLITAYEQYSHLDYLEQVIQEDKTLASTLGSGYIVKPDVVICRKPIDDSEINKHDTLIHNSDNIASLTPFRVQNNAGIEILHASISCKFTIRSDRSQNTRTEALNLIRNRKGKLPHVIAVTGEPLPTRISALALGTGDLDCVYHFALYELQNALEELDNEDQLDMLNVMIDSKRLRDISDLPFDLAT